MRQLLNDMLVLHYLLQFYSVNIHHIEHIVGCRIIFSRVPYVYPPVWLGSETLRNRKLFFDIYMHKYDCGNIGTIYYVR